MYKKFFVVNLYQAKKITSKFALFSIGYEAYVRAEQINSNA